jgi:hypothetical protein
VPWGKWDCIMILAVFIGVLLTPVP